LNRKDLLGVRLQRHCGYSVRSKPLDDVTNQKSKKCITGKSKMDLKVSDHNPATGNGRVLNHTVCRLKAFKEHKTKKIEGRQRGLLQVPDTLANIHRAGLNRSCAVENACCSMKAQNRKGQ
jgi:hypothetical protein